MKLSIPKIWVIKSTLFWIVFQGKKVGVYEHAPADSAQYDEAVAGERLVEVEHLNNRSQFKSHSAS